MRRISITVVLLAALLYVSASSAQQASTTAVPNLIRYGGTLKDANGAPIAGTTGVTFAIYKQQDGGAPIWVETQNVALDAAGDYSLLLGNTTATGLPSDLFSQQEQRWLGVQVQGEPEQPRVLLVSVPYALKAHEAETLGGKSVADFVLANSLTSTANSGKGGQGPSSSPNASGAPENGVRKGAANDGPTNFSGSTADQIVAVTQSGTGVGLGASAPSKAVVGNATAAGGIGVMGQATAASGSAIGVYGSVASSSGVAGVFTNNAGGAILSGQNNGKVKFSVDGTGDVNSTSGTYQIGGSSVVSIGNPSDDNLFLGAGAGLENVAGSGIFNTFSGYQAGYSNTTGQQNTFSGFFAGRNNIRGSYNTFSGTGAGVGNTGSRNTFSGFEAGYNNGADDNVFIGYQAGYTNADGYANVFSGYQAGFSNNTGAGNTLSGFQAGYHNNSGLGNTFSGYQAGLYNTTGNDNTFLGEAAGNDNEVGSANTFLGSAAGSSNVAGNNNVYIANPGPISDESNTIRIGGNTTDRYGPQTAAYIVGIYGSTSSSGIPVYINSSGQLGTITSSIRFKEQVHDMSDRSNALMKLRPVTFLYKPEYAKGERTLQYGLIAEEVAQVYPELVVYDNDGQPYSVRYQYLPTMLLKEVQKQYRRAEAEAKLIRAQQNEIQVLQEQNQEFQERLSRLERLVPQAVARK